MDIDITIGEQGQTALHIAAHECHRGAVKALLDAGADPNKTNEFGFAALIEASRAPYMTSDARLSCVQILVDAGADVKVSGERGK